MMYTMPSGISIISPKPMSPIKPNTKPKTAPMRPPINPKNPPMIPPNAPPMPPINPPNTLARIEPTGTKKAKIGRASCRERV